MSYRIQVTLAATLMAAILSDTGVSAQQQRTLRGVVRDVSGGAVDHAEVFVGCGALWRRTESNGSGEFAVAGLPPGACGVRVERDDLAPQRLTVDLADGDEQVAVQLQLRGLATEVAVTPAGLVEEETTLLPVLTTTTDSADIEARVHQVLPQALAGEPGISVQQTSSSQGAPIIRGLIGQQNVLVIDGVRVNTAAWRSGPSQYLAWYASSLVDRLEVLRGPSSVLSGSDALGGTVHVRSLRPSLSGGAVRADGALSLGGSTSDSGGGFDGLVRVSGREAGVLVAVGYQRAGDLRPGGGIDSHAAVTRFLGLPSTAVNGSRLRETGFEQRFAHVAATVALGGSSRLEAGSFMSEQVDGSRFDRMDGGEGLYRSDFAPQRLLLAHVRLEQGRTRFADQVQATFSVNRQSDGRVEQARASSPVDAQQNRTTAFGYQVHAARQSGRHAVSFGAEAYDEYIAGSRTITTGSAVRAARPDIPDGTRYTTAAGYAQDVFTLARDRAWLRGGLRYSRYDFGTTADAALGVIDESVSGSAVTGQAALVVSAGGGWTLTGSVSRGFRAPNAFDLGSIGVTSVFEVAPSRAAALGALVGTSDGASAVSTGRSIEALSPEWATAFEGGARFQSSRVSLAVTVFDTELRDTILRRAAIFPSAVVGRSIGGYEITRQDAAGRAFIATSSAPLLTRVNVSRARIWGVEGEGIVRLADRWTASGVWSYARGTDLDAGRPLRRVPPGNGALTLRWDVRPSRLWVEGQGTFALAYERMAPGDLTDARMGARRDLNSIAAFFNGRAVDLGLVRDGVLQATGERLADVQARVLGGATSAPLFDSLPGYAVMTVRAGYRVTPNLSVLVIGDNLADTNYRRIGSGFDAPGSTLTIRTRVSF